MRERHNPGNSLLRSQTNAGFLLFVLLLTAFATGCKEKVKPGTAELKRPAVSGVAVTEVVPSKVDEYFETSGTIKAKATSAVASRLMATVTSVKVREGERVNAGQVLLTLDDRDVTQRVVAAEKTVEAARQNKRLASVTSERYQRLYDEKALTRQEIDQINAQKNVADIEFERAGAGLAEARIHHGFATLTAPFAGVVTEKKVDAGAMAVPGTPLLVLEDTSSFRLETYVDERLMGKLKAGMPVEVFLGSPPQTARGKISEIVPAIDPLTRTFLIKVEVAAPGLRSGLYAKIRLPIGTKEAILLPKAAVIERGQLTGVYTVDDKGIITYRLVRTGKETGNAVEILSGLNPQERVITSGAEKAVDGGLAVPAEKSPASPDRER